MGEYIFIGIIAILGILTGLFYEFPWEKEKLSEKDVRKIVKEEILKKEEQSK